jgi:hypothetical protein
MLRASWEIGSYIEDRVLNIPLRLLQDEGEGTSLDKDFIEL